MIRETKIEIFLITAKGMEFIFQMFYQLTIAIL